MTEPIERVSLERRRYAKVSLRIWSDQDFDSLSKPKPNAQTLLFRLLVSPEKLSVPGLIPIGEAGLAEKLRWPLRAFRRCFRELEQAGIAKADWRAGLIWLVNAVNHNRPENPNVLASWRVGFDEIPDCDLKYEALQSLEGFVKGLPEPFRKAWQTGRRPPFAKSFPTNSNSNSNSNSVRATHAKPFDGTRGGHLLAGSTPLDYHKEHRAHTWCGELGRLCIPAFLHNELMRNYGKSRDEADTWLKARYAGWERDLATSGATVDDAPKWVRERFAEAVRATQSRGVSHLPEWFECRVCGGAHQGRAGDPCVAKAPVGAA